MSVALQRTGLALVVCCIAIGCSGEDSKLVVASVHPRAAWVLEGGAPRIGEVALLDAVVIAPPGFTPAPLVAPRNVRGFEIYGEEDPTVREETGRWIHRTRLRIRARELGRFEWPGAEMKIESVGGESMQMTLEPLTIEVRSVMAEHPGRDTPYGVIEAPRSPEAGDFLRGVAVGGLGVLALVGLAAVVRRRRSPAPALEKSATGSPPKPPWVEAHDALARARIETDPLRAAHIAAETLSLYSARRFDADTHARTTDELAAAMPPLRATSRWPILISILRELDGLRFRPAALGDHTAATAADLLTRAEAFIDDTTPSEQRPR